MARFTFLHAADLHLGSPFVGLTLKEPEIAARFSTAGREAFSALVDRAIEEKVAFVLIAGDVYDREWRDTSIGLFFNREVSRLARADVPAFLIRGNHDAESVVTKSLPAPEGVHGFSARKPETHRLDDLKVAIHGQSFPDRAVGENLAINYPDPEPGWFNIGLLHTSLDGRPGHATYAPCTIEDLRLRNYDYWALGHIHAHEIVSRDPFVVYPGNLQGRNIRETGEKGAVLVSVENGSVSQIEHLVFDRARWARVSVDIAEVEDEPGLLALVQSSLRDALAGPDDRLLALRLTLSGVGPLHHHLVAERERLAAEVQAICHHIHLDLWLERLVVATRAPERSLQAVGELSAIDVDVLLAQIAEEPDIAEEVSALVTQIGTRLPAGIAIEGALDPAALIAEARDLAVARCGGGAG
ncbi:metallophosphoesterase family protein [Consotaella salsifontis]|uniref:DNA repair exonuclease SbcCD nuclease subunit n=1 Tax=Consotaella salsifontis TaxID=1365950 RepID=A0A1T4T7S2_9HYPH|nr:DNA repair exonuclease [Consotaella salsifontis]SKA36281.1 DNA repair exonuclease SbcCD nuclease subunit [Consotaella salsifontis]